MKFAQNILSHSATRLVLVLGIGFAILWDLLPTRQMPNRVEAMPLTGARYQMRPAPLTATEKATFRGATVTKRLIRCTGQPPLLLTVIDGGRNSHAVHDPTYCLRGGGWEIVSGDTLPMPGGTAHWMRLRRKMEGTSQTLEAVYWYTNGKQQYTSPLRCWGDSALHRLSLGWLRPAPSFVLVQTLIEEDSFPDWQRVREDMPPLFAL